MCRAIQYISPLLETGGIFSCPLSAARRSAKPASLISQDEVVVSANLLHGFGPFNLRQPRRREREGGCKRGKAFKLPPCSADRHNRIAHQAQRSQTLTSSPLSAISLYGSRSLLRHCHTARELSLVLQNKTSKSVEKVRGYNTGVVVKAWGTAAGAGHGERRSWCHLVFRM